jgi:hypothetical protein
MGNQTEEQGPIPNSILKKILTDIVASLACWVVYSMKILQPSKTLLTWKSLDKQTAHLIIHTHMTSGWKIAEP